MKKRKNNLPDVLLVAAAVYVIAAYTMFRMRHPDMSETNLFLHFWDAMTWREVAK